MDKIENTKKNQKTRPQTSRLVNVKTWLLFKSFDAIVAGRWVG